MDAFSTRLGAGNARGASEIYRAHLPSKGNRRRLLQRYAHIVINPRAQSHSSKGQLDAHRLYAFQVLAQAWPSIALDAAQMASSAPRELPFKFTALDAWRIAVDQLHTLKRGRRLEVAA
ncbi:TPA: hypothetical protein ACNVWL_003544 [Pseudomonas aeruginosa]|uniref:hypothetical protein n=1 Tax=Pseudomonas aeruginosa TaxID=287 RepID=UPI00235A20FB|nr:hypothetical protein [Pseudomonas aeruginosa]WEO43450.1 hypothetical protein PUL49_08440 [Pseudomonas aeruginosa]